MRDIGEVTQEGIGDILNSLNAGVYVTDTDRRILFWNRQAERITGFKAKDVAGRQCRDGLLDHTDKEGASLCATDRCPLYRSMATNTPSARPLLVYAGSASGERIPVSTSVAPLHDGEGNVIGGIEVFRDERDNMYQLELARTVQRQMLPSGLPDNDHVSFALEYIPVDMIGGDFCHIEPVAEKVCNLFLADVAGHNISSALYTTLLHSVVDECVERMADPAAFLAAVNARLCSRAPMVGLVTAVTVTFDCAAGTAAYCSAGHPSLLVQPAGGGTIRELESLDLPLGIEGSAEFETREFSLSPGDRIFACTDGAVEIPIDATHRLGTAGLMELLNEFSPRGTEHRLGPLYAELLRRCAVTAQEDDITLVSCIIR